MPDVLSEKYIQVDERSMPDLLNAMRLHAENINFYDLDGNVNGNWLNLLLSNDAILLSSTIPIDLSELKKTFIVKKSLGLRQAISENWKHIKWINNWLFHAKSFNSPEGFDLFIKVRGMIRSSIVVAAADVYNLSTIFSRGNSYSFEGFDAVWDIENSIRNRDTLKIYRSRQQKEERLSSVFNAIINIFSFLSRESEKAFKKSLQHQTHDPASGMILAFLHVYKRSQEKTNQFTERMLEYYYSQILRNRAIKSGGDKVYLECQLNPTANPVLIPEGTRFIAGKTEDLQDILYQSQSDTLISGARLVALKTLFLQRHLLISPENLTRSVSRIKSSNLLEHSDRNNVMLPHTLFGYDDASGYSTGDDNETGMVISSNILKLKEGRRRINVVFSAVDKRLENIKSDTEIKTVVIRIAEKIKKSDISSDVFILSELFFNKLYVGIDKNNNQLKLDLYEMFNNVYLDVSINNRPDAIISELHEKSLYLILLKSRSKESFLSLFHKIICRYIFNFSNIEKNIKKQIIDKAKIVLVNNSKNTRQNKQALSRIIKEISMSRQVLFLRYFSNAFVLKITSAYGWYEVSKYALSHVKDNAGFELAFDINRDADQIIDYDREIHGGRHNPGSPLLTICINPSADVYPYSYLEPFAITRIRLNVQVKGYKSLSIQNDHGLVDRSKPFMPFGPFPVKGSSCYIGGLEYAGKNTVKITLNISWKNLPTNYGGMSGYYEEYNKKIRNADFNVRLSLSSAGKWQPHNEKQQQVSRLFSQIDDSEILLKRNKININLKGQYPILTEKLEEREFNDLNDIRNGHIKLSLSTAEMVFGHKIYPEIMGNALTINAKNKKQINLPQQPYTPEIDSLSIDYCAEEFINVNSSRMKSVKCYNQNDKNATESQSRAGLAHETTVYYITPFGNESINEEAASKGIDFFPQWKDDGNLYIGFNNERNAEYLNIYFQLRNDSTHSPGTINNPVKGSYYSAKGWRSIRKDDIVYDSTGNMMHTGVVTIRVAHDISCHPVMVPDNTYWFVISASHNLSHYSTVQSVGFDVIRLSSVDDRIKLSSSAGGISGSWRALKDIAGLKVYRQSQSAFSSTDTEDSRQSRVRFYERLRHKNRAINVWDYERLVLEAFPQLHLVKCFAATSSRQLTPSPGHVLIVVVPKVAESIEIYKTGYHVNSVVLQEILDYIRALAPSNITLEVRNPVYESIQVRCAVRFNSSHNPGQLLKRFSRHISDYLSPWSETGSVSRFGWTIPIRDLESYLLDLAYVDDVARLSMIDIRQIENKPKKYRFKDSANKQHMGHLSEEKNRIDQNGLERSPQGASSGGMHSGNINPRNINPGNINPGNINSGEVISSALPWSLTIPARKHHIEVINDERMHQRDPVSVGISSLRIGDNFIIQDMQGTAEGTKRDAFS
ncbi:hypothetical protein MNBD_GAMMA11-79 [hydrothermal vent metagenome]|uniref:Baseplate protein J-like domain-containing protein n=1 Tax=hydrothermal vent metagenome TaxID=652676 RepID=A0A3B0XUM1_9ZZZZ